MPWLLNTIDREILISYHIFEEIAIAVICVVIAVRALSVFVSLDSGDKEGKSRTLLICAGFAFLGISSLLHAVIHAAGYHLNTLYQTLFGYCLGLILIIIAISSERPWRKIPVALLYLPLLIFLVPHIYRQFPLFREFRPTVWIIVAYLSGVVCILYIATYFQTRIRRYSMSALGHLLICAGAIALFFPSGIGSSAWIYGHVLRPMGFVVLLFSMNREELVNLRESLIYKFIATFSLMTSIPLLIFGLVMFYETINPVQIVGRRMIVFLMVVVMLVCVLLFALILIIRLLRPLVSLKGEVDKIAEEGLDRQIDMKRSDEIGKLSHAFNEMTLRLKDSLSERDRLSRLAATGELSATLAHEIKNPLNAISTAALYIKNNFSGSLIREFVSVIHDEALRINKLTSNLLNFSKPVQFEPALSDINALVTETLALLREECEERGVSVETDLQKDSPLILFDKNLMKQVLINLILNSLDARSSNRKIVIRTMISGGNVHLSVQDFGEGISKDDMKNIFNPFFTTKTRGTGLGLSITEKTVKEHGGDIMVESSPGEGSVFTIVLPIRE